jgi:hypothetical protein
MSSPTQYNPYSHNACGHPVPHNYQTQTQINSTDNNYLITMRRNEKLVQLFRSFLKIFL